MYMVWQWVGNRKSHLYLYTKDKFEQAIKEKLIAVLSTTKLQKSSIQQIINNLVDVLGDNNITELIRMGILSASVNRYLRKELSISMYVKVGQK